ncbi:MAG: hypothetical protein WC769_06625 [Thermodesulfovibrionales bacterium]|jgi:hypothetical protein
MATKKVAAKPRKVAAKKTTVKKATAKKTTLKKTTAKKTVKPAGRKKKEVTPGDKYSCSVCGLIVSVDEESGFIETCDIICCGEQMKTKK